MKKIINASETVVEDYITGLVEAQPHLMRVAGWPVVVRTAASRKRDLVALVSGGGSGHEPAHAGYVGFGMLDAAVLGPVFTSPSVDAVYAAIMASATPAGVLLIVKNYTGDRLNFGMAAEMARAAGVRVATVTVADDAALGDSSRAGRRGLTATVLVHKIAGAAAERGASLDEIVALCESLLAGTATVGLGLGPCTVPGASGPNFDLGDTEVEWGLGIHGEAGSERAELEPSREIARRMVATLTADRGWAPGAEVVVLVNSLGGTPDLELRILQHDVLEAVSQAGLVTRCTIAGPLLTSLEMAGASVTIAELTTEQLELLLEPSRTAAFPAALGSYDPKRETVVPDPVAAADSSGPEQDEAAGAAGQRPDDEVAHLHRIVMSVAGTVQGAEAHLTELDRSVGDGDLGINLARGAAALIAAEAALLAARNEAHYLALVSAILRREVGGTSGPLYGLLLLTMSERLAAAQRGSERPSSADWTEAIAEGTAHIRRVGGAAPGDSTMIDALQPAVDVLLAGDDLAAAARAARAGAGATAELRPSLGRSSYLGERAVGVPDPGAIAIALQFETLACSAGRGNEQ